MGAFRHSLPHHVAAPQRLARISTVIVLLGAWLAMAAATARAEPPQPPIDLRETLLRTAERPAVQAEHAQAAAADSAAQASSRAAY